MERVYTTVDKSEWGPGPWDGEPDKVQFKDEASGLPCLVKRGPMGAWCGYVGVSEGHPAFEKTYWDVDVEVHGGLTYADHCADGPEDSSICHIPDPGEPDHVWWLGFDCGHSFDLVPRIAASDRRRYEETGDSLWFHDGSEVYRDIAYARRQTVALARQLAELVTA